MTTVCLAYMDSAININIEENNLYLLEEIIKLFKTHFVVKNEADDAPTASFNIFSYKDYKKDKYLLEASQGREVIMRVSSAARFNLSAVHYQKEDLDIFECIDSETVMIFDFKNKKADIYASTDSDIQIIELIRDTIIKDQENKGSLILHAAAAVKNNKTIVIVGSKGAGKTTTLLELVLNGGYKLLSGDKVFVRVDENGIKLKGWSDYPHLGVGTILKHPRITEMVKRRYCKDVENMAFNKKILINPNVFAEETGIEFCSELHGLDKILFPSLVDGADSILTKLDKPCEQDIIDNLEFRADYPQNSWNKLIIPHDKNRAANTAKLAEAVKSNSYYILQGDLKLSEEIVKELAI